MAYNTGHKNTTKYMGPALNYSLMLEVCSDKMYTMAAGGNCCFGGEYYTSGDECLSFFVAVGILANRLCFNVRLDKC